MSELTIEDQELKTISEAREKLEEQRAALKREQGNLRAEQESLTSEAAIAEYYGDALAGRLDASVLHQRRERVAQIDDRLVEIGNWTLGVRRELSLLEGQARRVQQTVQKRRKFQRWLEAIEEAREQKGPIRRVRSPETRTDVSVERAFQACRTLAEKLGESAQNAAEELGRELRVLERAAREGNPTQTTLEPSRRRRGVRRPGRQRRAPR